MRKLASLVLVCGALWAQDLPPAAAAPVVPAAPMVLANTGKPMLVPFRCTEEDIRSAGLTCSEQDPCPVYLELAAVESTGIRIFATGNIHTVTATLYTIMVTGSIWEKDVFGVWLFAPAFYWEDVFSMLVLALHTAYLVALAAGWGDAHSLMLLALAAYATYVINATQFLLKLRAARLQHAAEARSGMMAEAA